MCRGPRTRTSASWTEHTSGFFLVFFWFSVPTSSGAEKQDLNRYPLGHDDEREDAPTA